MKFFKLIILTLFFAQTMLGQYTGTVFNDVNENGKFDKTEKPIPGAVVSNGFHIVKTNKKGEYSLPQWEKARFVTIYPAANQKITKQRYLRLGNKTNGYNFGVTLTKIDKNVSFLHVSDTETNEHKDWMNDVRGYVKNNNIDFVMHTGDICYHSGMDWHAENMNKKTLGVPVYYCVGNHDLVAGDYGEQYFEELFGPVCYSFQKGNALYIVTPIMFGDYKPGYTSEEIGGWLKNLLKTYPADMPKYYFNHTLLSEDDDFVFKLNKKDSIVLNDYNMKAWTYGHWHSNITRTSKHTKIKTYSTATAAKGGIDHSPSSFRIVNVDEKGNSTSKLVWTFVDEDLQIISPNNNASMTGENGEITIAVNTYHSESVVDSVKYKVYPIKGLNWDTYAKSPWKHLKKASDWGWKGFYTPKNTELYGIVVNAYFNDGKVLNESTQFTPYKNKTPFHTNTKWNNLAGNPEHDAVTKEKHHHHQYKLAWTTNVGSNIFMSSPLINNDKIYTASFDDGNSTNNYIHCLDAKTGKQLWKYKTRNSIKNQMIIAGNYVIGTDVQGITYAINLNTGKEFWVKDLEYDKLPGFVSGLVTDGNIVYTGFGESLCAIEVNTAKVLWKNNEWSGGEGSTPTMTLTKNHLIVSSNWKALYAHDKKTGKVIWSKSDNGLRFRNGNVLYKNNLLWISENDENGGLIHVLNPEDGTYVRKIKTEMDNKGTNTPVVTSSHIYIAAADPGIAAFDKETGNKLWEFNVLPSIFHTPQYYSDQQRTIETTPMLIGKNLVFGAMDGWVYSLNATTGNLGWKYKLGSPVLTSAAVTKNGFIIADFAGNVYYFINENDHNHGHHHHH